MKNTRTKPKKRENIDHSHAEGIIFITRKKIGYIKDERFDADIEIQSTELGTALNGDTVRIELLGKTRNRIQGSILKVIDRNKTRFVGILEQQHGNYFLNPDDPKIHVNISLRSKDVSTLPAKTKLYVEIDEWTNPRTNPTGSVIEVLGKAGTHNVEMESIIFEHGFEPTFARRVEEEAAQIATQKEITKEDSSRRDMRGITTFTIDPFDAKDFDDALSIQFLKNGDVEIGIHIADVTHYVRPGSHLEEEAQKRATSIYLVDRTIPMLPEVLSNDVCSLVQGEDRRTFSTILVFDTHARIKDRWFGETIIHSNKRFTYEEAQNILNRGSGLLFRELSTLNTLAKKLRKGREKSGMISFEQDEVQFILDKNGKPIDVYTKKRNDTNRMIEDFMLAANEEVATYMYQNTSKKSGKDAVFIYRIHDVPNPEKIEELGIFIRAIGYDFDTQGGKISAKNINKLFAEIKGTPEENLIKVATIRSMAKAVYSTKNIGHFGLAFKYYTHFTSPIRRYPDMMVHRILKNHLNQVKISDQDIAKYNYMAIKSSQREVEAVRAERDSIKYKQVEYMLDRVGQTFKGTITGVTEWGVYVEEEHTKAEGLVRMSTLKDDYYVLDQKHYRVVGERSKKKFALGDPVKIKLTAADLDRRTLDFTFI